MAKKSTADNVTFIRATDAIPACTNILNIVVPPQLKTKARTGIDWFDAAADPDDPGITPSTVMLLTAKPGCGKSTLVRQIADSATKEGHIVLYNAGEESVYQVRKTCDRLNLEHGFIISSDRLIRDVLDHAEKLISKNPGKQLILALDSLATLDDGKYASGHINSMTAVRVTEEIVEFCKRTFAIALIIGHVNKKGEFAGKQQLKHEIDAHGHMKFVNGSNRRTFIFSKNRFGQISTKGTMLEMTAGGLMQINEDVEIDIDEDEDSDLTTG